MQDAIYKPHQVNDEVFTVLYCIEQPFLPICVKCIVKNVARMSSTTTYYHLMPIECITAMPNIVTIRCINLKIQQIKDITMHFDNELTLNWPQQFVTFNDNWYIDAQHHSVYADINEAVSIIHNLNNSLMQQLSTVIADLGKQNAALFNKIQ